MDVAKRKTAVAVSQLDGKEKQHGNAEEFGDDILRSVNKETAVFRKPCIKTMPKRKNPAPGAANRTAKDNKTLGSIRGLADRVVQSADRGRPHLWIFRRDLIQRAVQQVEADHRDGQRDQPSRVVQSGAGQEATCRRCWSAGCKQLIEQGKTTSIRGLFYLLKHTIEGTSEETFDTQAECDPMIEDVEVALNALREELHVYAKNRGPWSVRSRSSTAATRSTVRGWARAATAFPRSSSRRSIEFKKCTAKFILHVEKDTVWRRFNEDKFWQKHNCILTHGGGQPPRGVRRMLNRLHNELEAAGLLPAG